MPATKKTDNHFTGDKVAIRIAHTPWPENRPPRVLDVFGGHGVVWRAIQRKTGRSVERVGIDNRHDLTAFHAHGDSIKVMSGLDLSRFDVVDLDGYGIPFDELCLTFERGYRGVVFVTCIQVLHGAMPAAMARALSIPDAVSREAPSLLARRGWELFKEWLALQGVGRIVHRSWRRKHYLAFSGVGLDAAGCDSPAASSAAGPS